MLTVGWVFSGWPQLPFTNFPPKVPKAYAAITIPSQTVSTMSQTGNNTAFSITIPSDVSGGIQAGDYIIVIAVNSEAEDNDWSPVPPSGMDGTWVNELQVGQVPPSIPGVHVFYELASGGESGTRTMTGDFGSSISGIAFVVRGVDSTTPLDVAVQTAQSSSTGDPNPPAITPANDDALILAVGIQDDTNAASMTSQPANYTSLAFINTNESTGNNVMAAYRILSGGASQSEDPGAWNIGANDEWAAATIALRPGVTNASPEAPTLSDVPFDNEKTGDSTPAFQFTANDPDGSAGITYQIQVDNDYAFGSPLINCESDTSCAAGAGSFTRSGDSDPFTEGQEVTFTPTTAMTTNTTYYWRVRAEDNSGEGGSGSYGDWSGIHSVTYVSGTDPSEWFQTTDEQFDTGTLSSTQISGSDSVELGSNLATITYDNAANNSGSLCASTSCSVSLSVAAGSNRMIIIASSFEGTTASINSIDLDASTGVGVVVGTAAVGSGTTQQTLEVWRIMETDIPDGAQTVSVTVNYSGTVNSGAISLTSFSGVAQQAEEAEDSTTQSATAATISTDITTLTDGALIISATGNGGGSGDYSHGTDQIERHHVDGLGGGAAHAVSSEILSSAGTDSQSHTYSASTNRATQYVAAFAPATSPASSGTIMSAPIDYDWVSGMSSWEEVSFSTTETNGDIKVSLFYNNGSDCDTIIPNAALSGNESGFDVSASPMDISGLNTTTYNRICLRATLTDSGGTPFLNDWTVTWSAGGASAPTVTTSAASSVDTDSATLNGNITNTGGADATQHGFAWGTNASLSGGDTATTTLGSKSGTGTFNEAISSLDPETTYYFRAYATNSGGTGYGSIQNFTTDALVYSVTVISSGTVEYGFVELSSASSTVGNGYTQTVENDGNTSEKLNVKSSNATGGTSWTLASSIDSDQFKHEFSTTTGSTWVVMPDSDTYVTAVPSVAESGTASFDFRLTTPSASSDYQQKSITITVQAVAP